MNIDNEIKKSITVGDIILVAAVALISLVLFLPSFFSQSDNLRAEIYLSGEKVEEIALSSYSQGETLKIGSCELLIEKDGVTFISSQCNDKLCIKRGKLTKSGDSMTCVPEKVVVVLKSDSREQPDGVSY